MKENLKAAWTNEEITLLADEYIKGTRIIDLAVMLKRTPTSLNKALHRFGIRKHIPRVKPLFTFENMAGNFISAASGKGKRRKQKMIYQRKAYPVVKKICVQKAKEENKSIIAQQMEAIVETQINYKVRRWVHMSCVLRYLREKNYLVFKTQAGITPADEVYHLNGNAYNHLQLVKFANADREKRGLSPLYVKGTTWE